MEVFAGDGSPENAFMHEGPQDGRPAELDKGGRDSHEQHKNQSAHAAPVFAQVGRLPVLSCVCDLEPTWYGHKQ